MKLLTNSISRPVLESNGAIHPAAPFVRILKDDGDAAVQPKCSKDKSGAATLGLAVLFVVAAGTLWGWAIVQLGGLFLQAEALLLRNTLPWS
jgi:hypothetical protein